MKKLISLLLVALLTMGAVFSVSAADTGRITTGKTVTEYGDWLYRKINNDTQWELNEYIGNDTEIIAPRVFGNLLVVSFGDHCFANNESIKSVITSSPLWTIGNYAFIDCKSLEYFELNYAFKTLGAGAFCGTSSLKSINLQDTVVEDIPDYAFMNSGLEQVELPSTCKSLGNYAFYGCASLKTVIIPDSVTEIDDTAFDGCSDDMFIICNSNSYAATYAASKNIDVLELDNPVYGDSNADGDVNILDATAIQRYKIGEQELNEYGIRCADVNHDGSITVRDATLIQMKIAKYNVDF